MRLNPSWLTGLALISIVASMGCTSEEPYTHPELIAENAFEDTIPDSAQYLEPDSFGSRLDDGSLQLLTKDDIPRELAEAEMELEELKQLASDLYSDRMDVLARHTVEPHDTHPDFAPLLDGNWRFQVDDEMAVQLSGVRYAYQELVESTQRFRTKENQLAVYTEFFARLDPAYIVERNLPDKGEATDLSYEEVFELNRVIAEDWGAFRGLAAGAKPPGYPTGKEDEEGYGGGVDEAMYPVRTGIGDQVDFPLKWYDTSIKQQGGRGSCVAFAVTAAVELTIARDQGRWVNLSEQMLYNRAKQVWEGSNYGDNYSLATMLFRMIGYRYSFEASWDYNTSRQRVEFDYGQLYLYSCWADTMATPYSGEHCSDTNHQASMFTTTVGGLSFTAFVNPETDVLPDAGFGTGIGSGIYDPGVVGTFWAIAMLRLDVPVMISFTMPVVGLSGALVGQSEGIVQHLAFEPAGTGGHAMLLIGFVPNAELPPGTPPSPGVGYFIAKNSWGYGYGDGGYVYLPDLWVQRWARGLYTLSGVY
ncbi:MAG: hypothetical protein KJO40_19755 [Deltaproteobacteria bacterium]|nr:hypothetical protein [Deltaproteobacteria bacterium]MBT8464157.1 hypothetical protein [Deltaproteobacteria bacterium]NNK07182.1 hypothetical protein [Myxococcales bacterium]